MAPGRSPPTTPSPAADRDEGRRSRSWGDCRASKNPRGASAFCQAARSTAPRFPESLLSLAYAEFVCQRPHISTPPASCVTRTYRRLSSGSAAGPTRPISTASARVRRSSTPRRVTQLTAAGGLQAAIPGWLPGTPEQSPASALMFAGLGIAGLCVSDPRWGMLDLPRAQDSTRATACSSTQAISSSASSKKPRRASSTSHSEPRAANCNCCSRKWRARSIPAWTMLRSRLMP
jgi:hypothetical protein